MTDLGDHLHYLQEFERLVAESVKLEYDMYNSCSKAESAAIIVKQNANQILLEEARAKLHQYLDLEDLVADMNRENDEDEF